MSLVPVDVFEVPPVVVGDTEASLRTAGRNGHELFVLWTGRVAGAIFQVRNSHVPRQTSYRTEDGCGVRVEGDALHELNRWLFEHGETLGAQVHSHPTDAFHSVTDDTYPIVTVEGGLSIVAANFGRDGLLAPTTATFRLTASGWTLSRPVIRVIDL
jgi:hypothetical protein